MRRRLASTLSASLVLAAGLGLAHAVLSLPPAPTGLRVRVDAALAASGVDHPVTAVLLNFRAYDTLLEIAVLLLALAGTWSLHAEPPAGPESPVGPMQDQLVQALVPLMVLVAGYLLWAGSEAPGGAFQAGAVLGAAGVLLRLSLRPLPGWRRPARYRAIASLGLVVFLAVAATTLRASQLLTYRGDRAAALILLIEAAAAISIGAILAALFVRRPPDLCAEREPNS